MSTALFQNKFICYEEVVSNFSNITTELEKERAWSICLRALVKKYSWLCHDAWLTRKFPVHAKDKDLFEETIKSAFFESILFTITKILNHPEKFDLQADIGSYLRTVLRNMAANAIRKVFNISQSNNTKTSGDYINPPNKSDELHSTSGNFQNFFFSQGDTLNCGIRIDSDYQEFPDECFAHIQLDKYRSQVLHRLFPGNPPLCGETIRYRCLNNFSGQDLFILLEYAIDRHLSAANPNFSINWSLPDLNKEIQQRGGKPYNAVQGLSNAVHRVIEKFVQLSVQAKSTCKNSFGKPCVCLLKSIGLEN